MKKIKLDNIAKVAQGRLSGFSANYIADTRVSAQWLLELVNEVRRLDHQRSIYRARVKALHKLIKDIPDMPEHKHYESEWTKGYNDGTASLAYRVRKILNSGVDI